MCVGEEMWLWSDRHYLSGQPDPAVEIHNYPGCDNTGSASPARVMVTLQAELGPKTNAHVAHSFTPADPRFRGVLEKQTDKTALLCLNAWTPDRAHCGPAVC